MSQALAGTSCQHISSSDHLSTPFHRYGNVCGWVLRGEIAKRGGGDAVASLTTNDKEIARNPHPPVGLGRDGPISLLLLLGDVPASTRRRASIWSPSRSQQTLPYLWMGVLTERDYLTHCSFQGRCLRIEVCRIHGALRSRFCSSFRSRRRCPRFSIRRTRRKSGCPLSA